MFESATPALQELLEIPFNLRLVAEMLSSDLSNSELTAIETQVGLLSQYWLHRVVKSASEGTAGSNPDRNGARRESEGDQ